MLPYTNGQLIRHKETGQSLFVLSTHPLFTFVVDLQEQANPLTLRVLLERDYPLWVDDYDMEKKEKTQGYDIQLEWKYNPLKKNGHVYL